VPNAIVSGSTVVQFDVIDEGAFERGDRECSPCSRGAMPTLEGRGRGERLSAARMQIESPTGCWAATWGCYFNEVNERLLSPFREGFPGLTG
jgi:hypothetical protein